MSIKSQRRANKRAQSQESAQQEQADKPKAGPGQHFRREMIAEIGGGHARVKRYRNVGASPLLLAKERGALTCDVEKAWVDNPQHNRPPAISAQERFDYGEKFEKWFYELIASPSRDSTIPQVSGGGGSRSITDVQQRAGEQIAMLRKRMGSRNYLIVEAFCGHGHSMLDSLRQAGVDAHPVGTAYRIREALDDLVCVMTGRQQVPILITA